MSTVKSPPPIIKTKFVKGVATYRKHKTEKIIKYFINKHHLRKIFGKC